MFILVLFLLKNREKSATMVGGKCRKKTQVIQKVEEIMSFSDLKLFALSSNRELAERVAQRLEWNWGNQVFANFQTGKFRSI